MPKRETDQHKPCPKCGKPIWYTSQLCRKCTAGLRQHPDALDKFHKPCPKCGQRMWRYAKQCFGCTGKKHRTPEERIEYRRAKGRRLYQRNKIKKLAKDKERYHKDPERFRAEKRAYIAAHREEMCLRAKRDYHEHRQERLVTDHAYRLRNHDSVKRKQRERYLQIDKVILKERRLAYYRSDKGKACFMRARVKHRDSPELLKLKYQLLWIEHRPCATCGSYDHREVDHIVERASGGQDDVSNLQVLCFTHHRKAGHGKHSVWRAES